MSHEEKAHSEANHVSVKTYMIGFALAIILTLISFGIIWAEVKPAYVAVIGLVAAAVIQILVHLYYFLHLNLSKQQQWNFISIAFTTLILLIFIAGSVWVIFTLNSRMM